MKNNILVMMSTFNGEKYIKKQIESLLNQKDVNLKIDIRDDGSNDDTLQILYNYSNEYDIVSYHKGSNIGYAKSFWQLVQNSDEYEYYAFCDQDDIWQDNKLARAIGLLKEQMNQDQPLLYTSRVESFNNDMELISQDTFKNHKILNVYESLQKSVVPGCVFVFNNATMKYLREYNGYIESHDWIVYLIVTIFGKVIFDDECYIKYRIHENNTIGQVSDFKRIRGKIKNFFRPNKNTRSKVAKDIYTTYNNRLSPVFSEDIKELAYYKDDFKLKLKLIINRNFKGFIFKLYVILGKV
ncbi:glycosyltransferase [[Eubacterium] hominis]|uniref:glycosyltransferase n=1 Tax=[Eubacterium] hominis TaxID=2764325 RepID=UPI003A4D9408